MQEKNGATIKANLLTELGIDEVFRRTQGAVTSDVLPDALGSSLALTDSTKALTTQYTYAPYGTTSQTGAANENSQKFTGREEDGTTGLYYYRARYYSPTYSRFVSEDPIGIAGGPNEYAYVGGNPVGLVDPLGLWSITLGAYVGLGGSLTFGQDAVTGGGFMTGAVGVGTGGGISWNPFGERPGSESGQSGNGGVGAGAFGAATFIAGPAQAAISGQAGVNIPLTGRPYPPSPYAQAGPSISLGDSWGFRAEAAIGVEFTIFGRRCPRP